MSKFSIQELPQEELKTLGLLKDGKLNVDGETKEALLNGRVTKMLNFKDLNIDGVKIDSLDAKVSLSQKQDGKLGLFVHPIYKERTNNPDLNAEENEAFSRGGTHAKDVAAYGKITSFGAAKYKFDIENKPSFFIELETKTGERKTIWGVDLERALEKSGKGVGDEVQLEFKGKQIVDVETKNGWQKAPRHTWEINDIDQQNPKSKTLLYEYDKETKSFVSMDSKDADIPESINGITLSELQKKKLRNGEVVSLPGNTAVQVSPANAKNGFFASNKNVLVTSIILDGGISFLLIKAAQLLLKENQKKQMEQLQDMQYYKGYKDALEKLQSQLQERSAQYPSDTKIADDLSIVKALYAKTTAPSYDSERESDLTKMEPSANTPAQDDNTHEN